MADCTCDPERVRRDPHMGRCASCLEDQRQINRRGSEQILVMLRRGGATGEVAETRRDRLSHYYAGQEPPPKPLAPTRCDNCDAPATCVTRFDGGAEPAYGCDDCCEHELPAEPDASTCVALVAEPAAAEAAE